MTEEGRQNQTYELDLLENGLDFVKSGIEIFFVEGSPEPRAHKYAILHVFSGMLLLMKERLARIRPSLAFERESEAGIRGAKTLDYHKTFARLEAHGVVVHSVKRAILDEIRDLRNAIEHYRVDLPLARSEEVIGEMISFVYSSCRDELDVHIDHRLVDDALDGFYSLREVGDRLLGDAIESANADAEADELYFREIEDRYAKMSQAELIIQSAESHSDLGNADLAYIECPTCRETSLLLLEVGACVNAACRAFHRLGTCHYCQEVALDGAYWCSACRHDRL